jgi:hypothetical protein
MVAAGINFFRNADPAEGVVFDFVEPIQIVKE